MSALGEFTAVNHPPFRPSASPPPLASLPFSRQARAGNHYGREWPTRVYRGKPVSLSLGGKSCGATRPNRVLTVALEAQGLLLLASGVPSECPLLPTSVVYRGKPRPPS